MNTKRTNVLGRGLIGPTLVLVAVAMLTMPAESFAQRGRGGGMRGGGGGGISHGSASFNRSPSMSRPSTPSMSRPSPGGNFGGQMGNRQPNFGGNLGGQLGGQQPNFGGAQRPNPGGQRPSTGAIGQGGRPSQSQLNNFLHIPSQGGTSAGVGNRMAQSPGAGNFGNRMQSGRPAGANSAVSDFFNSGAAPGAAGGGSLASGRSDNISNRTDARSDLRDSRGENRDFASDNRQDRVQDRGDRQAARVDNRGEFRSSLADGRADRRTDRQENLGNNADSIRDEMKNHFDDNHLFEDFWYDHPHAYWHFQQNPVFWTWATFNTVAAFMPWNWGTPVYYYYGEGGNVYYEGDTVYANGEEVPADEYAQQAEQIATSAPEVANPDDMEWLPLGVFAITKDGDPKAVPNMFLQLAVSKEGIIAGTLQNKTTDEIQSIEGMVDQKSQRAAWTISGKNTPIMETGIANLTENETTALVHFADGTTQQWLMLHVENPNAEGQTQPQQ